MNSYGAKSIAVFLLVSLFLVGAVSAAGPFNIVSSVSPQNPQPNNATNFTFNVTNIGGGSMKNIRIYAPVGFNINSLISCPSGTTTNTSNSTFVECKKCSDSGWSGVQQIRLVSTPPNLCGVYVWNVTANTGCNGRDDSDLAPANLSVCTPTTPLSITLLNPANGSTVNSSTINFSWTTNYANATCNLTVDNQTYANIPGILGNYTYTANVSGGNPHTWTVSCAAGSVSNSTSGSFNVQIPNPYLTVTKVVINNNGGTKTVSSFPLFVGNASVTSGVQSQFAPGTYAVSETNATGYNATFTGNCSANGTITLASGQNYTCTITNDDQPATLIVIKAVVNNNGGNNAASSFNMTVNGTNASQTSFPGSASGTTVTLNAGAYSVDELAASGYAKTIGANCSGTIANGETKTCTITNDDQAASITLVKNVVSNNGGAAGANDFGLSIGNTSVNSSQTLQVNSNTAYAINEVGLAGYAFTGISGAGCPASLGGTATLNEGDSITCTITNDDQPAKLVVIKQVANDNGGSATPSSFTMSVNGSSPSPSSFAGSATGTNVTLNAGSYSVSETGPAGYAASYSADCNGTISVGQTKTCTVTNDDIGGTIKVVKTFVNDNGGTASTVQLYVDGGAVANNTPTSVNAGTHSVTEASLSGYTATYGGDCNVDGQVTVGLGESKTCTIENNDVAGTLTVVKTFVNDNGGTATNATLYVNQQQVANNTPVTLNPGTYTVSEGNIPGYGATFSGDCDANGAVVVVAGQSKTCTITNDDQAASITLIKNVVNDNGGNAGENDFGLTIGETGVESGETLQVDANTEYALNEEGLAGYTFTGISGDEGCPSELGGTVTLGVGESITCTITNDDQPATLTVYKFVNNSNGGTANSYDFNITVSDDYEYGETFAGDEAGTVLTLDSGTYYISETQMQGYSASYSGDCVDEDGVSVALTPGSNKTCNITNSDDVQPTLTLRKIVDNGEQEEGYTKYDFTPAVNGTNYTWDEAITLASGTYQISESGPQGYAATYSQGCENGQVALLPGDNKECTVTNTLIPNTPPVINELSLSQSGSIMTCSIRASDLESGVLLVDYTLSKNGVQQANGTANVSNNTLTAIASAGGVGYSETWSCDVSVSDGADSTTGAVSIGTGAAPSNPNPGPGPSSGGMAFPTPRGGPTSGGGNKTPEQPPETATQPVTQAAPRSPTFPFAGFSLPYGGPDTGGLLSAQIGEKQPEPTTGAALFGLNLPFEPWVCALPLILLALVALWLFFKNRKKKAPPAAAQAGAKK